MLALWSCCSSRTDATDATIPVITQTALRSQPQSVAAYTGDLEIPECTICLEAGSSHVRLRLSCGHVFCRPCMKRYVQHEQREQRVACCPNCKHTLLRDELCVCLPDAEVDRLIAGAAERVASTDGLQDEPPLDLPGLKCCPNCNVRIEKNGGCNHMQCRCGHRFNWSDVPFAGKCDCAIVNARSHKPWGQTCLHCSWGDVGRLTLWRSFFVGAVVVIVPIMLTYKGAKFIAAGCTMRKACETAVELANRNHREALANVIFAEQDLVREQQRWFNRRAVNAARARWDASSVQLCVAQNEVQAAEERQATEERQKAQKELMLKLQELLKDARPTVQSW